MQIKRVNISKIEDGMITAEDIYNSSDQLIVAKDTVLNDKIITRLQFHNINTVRIVIFEEGDEISSDVDTPQSSILDAISIGPSYYDKLSDTEEFIAFSNKFNDVVSDSVNKINKLINTGDETDALTIPDGVKELLSTCKTGIQVFDLLHCMRTSDDISFSHSINVSLICAVLGTWLGFSKADINILIQCGIFHDIGKLKIPKSISEKPGKLTADEYKVMQTHTMHGYNILRNTNLDKRVKFAAMMHHERCDGSGYPLQLPEAKIDDFSKIVAIADVYDAMTSPRIYRKAHCPFEAIHAFETNGLTAYDTKYVLTFLEHISQSYLGNKVRLNDGTIGLIIFNNKQLYSRPMIQVGDNYIDLAKTPEKYIEAIM